MSAVMASLENLTVTVPHQGGRAAIIDRVSLNIHEGEVLALVGESGCGKSMTALAMMRLVPKPCRVEAASSITFDGSDLMALSVPQMRDLRGSQIAMIFQDPMTSLNPVQRVGDQLVEAIRLHERITPKAARGRVVEIFERVGIPDPAVRFSSYPHMLSGGLKQRVMIAMALAMRPRLLIADEPTTALDVTIQAQILSLLRELQRDFGTTIVLITHDFGVVNELADRVAVMYAGRVVEEGPRRAILGGAGHPYTRGLLQSIPTAGLRGARLAEIDGVVPPVGTWPAGCRFADRCAERLAPCAGDIPPGVDMGDDHSAWCFALTDKAGAR